MGTRQSQTASYGLGVCSPTPRPPNHTMILNMPRHSSRAVHYSLSRSSLCLLTVGRQHTSGTTIILGRLVDASYPTSSLSYSCKLIPSKQRSLRNAVSGRNDS